MKLILLPGVSRKNKEWISEVDSSLKNLFSKTYVQEYLHWQKEMADMDFELELERLVKKAGSLSNYMIFAKSAGVILALKAIYEKLIKAEGCIFCGMAVFWARARGFDVDLWVKNYSTPTLFIQKASDPAFPSRDLRELLQKVGATNFRLVEIPGEDHHYGDIGGLKELTCEFLKSRNF